MDALDVNLQFALHTDYGEKCEVEVSRLQSSIEAAQPASKTDRTAGEF